MIATDGPLVKVENLSVHFTNADATVHAVNGVSFTLERGEVLGILGESGSGKSVTLKTMMRLLPARKTRLGGSVKVAGHDVMKLDGRGLTAYRGRVVSMIFQEPMLAFDPVFTIGQQIAETVIQHEGLSRDAAIRAMTLGSAELLGIDNRLGSIETGKIANLAIVKGDLFGRDKFVPQIIVDGKVFEQKETPRAAPGAGRGPGGGRGVAGADATPAGPNVGGNYSITIDIPGQPLTATLNFTQEGSSITGTMVSQAGTTQIKDGRVTADGGFSFSGTVNYGGTALDITVHGTVNGNQVSGTVDSVAGSVPFSGTKNP